ncbi:MAG: hypothetical protein WD535_04600 [Thermaerobacterales bacterium]
MARYRYTPFGDVLTSGNRYFGYGLDVNLNLGLNTGEVEGYLQEESRRWEEFNVAIGQIQSEMQPSGWFTRVLMNHPAYYETLWWASTGHRLNTEFAFVGNSLGFGLDLRGRQYLATARRLNWRTMIDRKQCPELVISEGQAVTLFRPHALEGPYSSLKRGLGKYKAGFGDIVFNKNNITLMADNSLILRSAQLAPHAGRSRFMTSSHQRSSLTGGGHGRSRRMPLPPKLSRHCLR